FRQPSPSEHGCSVTPPWLVGREESVSFNNHLLYLEPQYPGGSTPRSLSALARRVSPWRTQLHWLLYVECPGANICRTAHPLFCRPTSLCRFPVWTRLALCRRHFAESTRPTTGG